MPVKWKALHSSLGIPLKIDQGVLGPGAHAAWRERPGGLEEVPTAGSLCCMDFWYLKCLSFGLHSWVSTLLHVQQEIVDMGARRFVTK